MFYFVKKIDMAKSKKYSFTKFQLDVTEQILQSICISDYHTRGRMSAGNAAHCLQEKQWRHFPRNISPLDA